MENDNWSQVDDGEVSTRAPAMGSAGDWRNQLQADSRHMFVNMIMETLKRHLPLPGPGLQKLEKMALGFEEIIYAAATSQSDYLRRISLKMLTIEDMNSQNPMLNSLQSHAVGPQAIPSQMQNQVQQIPIPIASNRTQVHLQPLSRNMPNNIAPTCAGSASALPPVGGMSQGTVPSFSDQNSILHNIQNMTGGAQNAAGTSRQMPTTSILQPSQRLVLQKSNQSTLQQQSQSVRQQQPHQLASMHQHPTMSLEQQQPNAANMSQNQIMGQPNNALAAQQQHERVIAQPIHHQNNNSNVHQHQVGARSNLSSFQPLQMGGNQHGMATTQSNQQPVHTLEQSKAPIQQQKPQSIGNILPNQSQSQLTRGLLGNLLQKSMQQKIQTSSPLLQRQITINQQKQSLQNQRVVPDLSDRSASGGDWQEEFHPKVKSMSPKRLRESVNDLKMVVGMVDRISGSAPGNGSWAAVGKDLVAMTKFGLQARNFFMHEGPGATKKMRRYTSAVPSNTVSSTRSLTYDMWHLSGNESDGESTRASSTFKRPRIEATYVLEEELQKINRRLIDTVVYICQDDVDPTAGIIVKCSYDAVALSHNLKSQYDSAPMSPIQPLRLLIPNSYPNCSPILLDEFPVEVSKEYEELSVKAKSRFSRSLRALEQPLSIEAIAKTWDACAHAVISEYAQQSGGGTFSSKYGKWENCLSAAS